MLKKRILISRTDSIGDVMLTLPITGYLKQQFPNCEIFFLAKNYTQPIIECAKYVDKFISWDAICKLSKSKQISTIKKFEIDIVIHVFPNKLFAEIAKKAGISIRIGSSHRYFHWLTCNRLIDFTRINSNLHESQLNFQLLKPITGEVNLQIADMQYLSGFVSPEITENVCQYINPFKRNIILHAKSKGSAREWGLTNFAKLIELLPKENYQIILTGTEEEGLLFRKVLVDPFPFVTDLSGKLTLNELIMLINKADALVACSTGPLHIAAALNKNAIGIYPPIKPIFPKRWGPIGSNSKVFVNEFECHACQKGGECKCMLEIKATDVANHIVNIY